MSTPTARKSVSNAPNNPLRRDPNENSPSRRPVPSTVPASTGQGLARTPSLRQSRPGRKPPSRMSSSFAYPDGEMDDEEASSANAQLIADLKEQVFRAEQASEQYRKQLEVMQKRLDDAAAEQTTSEERDYHRQTEIDHLRAEIKDSARQRRELELAFESEKRTFDQERERQNKKEADLQAVISRLNEALRSRGAERVNANRSASMTELQDEKIDGEIAPRENGSPDFLQTLQQKDAAIEALRLDLAEAQLKLAEQEHMGDGHLQSLEKAIMEIKMQNARLVEENESFQMLLSEKTLKGDFLHDHHADVSGMSTLAEELESTEEDSEGQSDAYKKLEAENKTLREGNKALTLYVDKIIGRLLQHEGFEHIIHDKDDPPKPPTKNGPIEKALPATPDQPGSATPAAMTAAGVANGLLQRARSVVSRPGGRARPMSYAQPVAPSPTANENPQTAPSIPIGRGHRRARSDQAQADMAAAAVVHQMNRGSPMRTVSGGPLSPGIRPLSPQLSQNRQSYFGQPANTTTRATSGSNPSGPRGGSSANSVTSDHSEEQKSGTDGSSTAQSSAQGQGNIPGAVMKQNQLRPLRLVQEQTLTDEEVQKRTNRGSWMGWLRGSTIEAQND